MNANQIIIGIVNGDTKAILEFENFVRTIIYSNPDLARNTVYQMEDVISELIQKILEDNRKILQNAKENKINKSFFKRWILWNISDLGKREKSNKIKNILDDYLYNTFQENEISEEEYIEIQYYNLKKSFEENDLFLKEVQKEAALKLCQELKSFLNSQKDIEKKVFCSYLGYIEKPIGISQANYNQIFRRLKKKIINFFNEKIVEIKELLKNGFFVNCELEDFCSSL